MPAVPPASLPPARPDRRDGPVVHLPEPVLVVLVGAAGSGKTTFAARHFADAVVVSSDALRETIAGDVADQSRNGVVFDALHRTVDRGLSAGRTVVVDATNVTAEARRALVARSSAAGVPAVAIVLDLPLAACLARNAGRTDRTVPSEAVERQHDRLRRDLARGGLDAEGFAAVHVLAGGRAIGSVRVERGPGRAPGPRG